MVAYPNVSDFKELQAWGRSELTKIARLLKEAEAAVTMATKLR
jgi:hypothetical protein